MLNLYSKIKLVPKSHSPLFEEELDDFLLFKIFILCCILGLISIINGLGEESIIKEN
jgi:hypothetical protein